MSSAVGMAVTPDVGTFGRREAFACTTRSGKPKRSYATEVEAKRDLRRANRHSHSFDGDGVAPYKCAKGDHWHLGHARRSA